MLPVVHDQIAGRIDLDSRFGKKRPPYSLTKVPNRTGHGRRTAMAADDISQLLATVRLAAWSTSKICG